MRLTLNSCTVRYPSTEALKDITLSIQQGVFLAIMGKTGSGKTTLLEVLAGLAKPTSGTVSPTGFSQSVGIVLQRPEDQLFASTVEEDVGFALKNLSLSPEEKSKRIGEALEAVGFTDRKACPLLLSGGQKRKVAIAGVLVFHPSVLLLDEPTSGLDPTGRKAMLQLLTSLNKQNVTIVMASHDADAVAECATRLIILDDGRIAQDGNPHEVFADVPNMKNLQVGVSHAREIAYLFEQKGYRLPEGIIKEEELEKALEAAPWMDA